MAQMGVAHNGGCAVVYCTVVDCDCKIIRATMTISVKSPVIVQRFRDIDKILQPCSVSGGADHNKGSSRLCASCSEMWCVLNDIFIQ